MPSNGTSATAEAAAPTLAQQREDLARRLNPEATPSELAWARNWLGRGEPMLASREPAAVPFPPDLSPAAIERLGLTAPDLDRLGLDEAGRVVDRERVTDALANIHGEPDIDRDPARLFGWLGLDNAVDRLGVGAARAEADAPEMEAAI